MEAKRNARKKKLEQISDRNKILFKAISNQKSFYSHLLNTNGNKPNMNNQVRKATFVHKTNNSHIGKNEKAHSEISNHGPSYLPPLRIQMNNNENSSKKRTFSLDSKLFMLKKAVTLKGNCYIIEMKELRK